MDGQLAALAMVGLVSLSSCAGGQTGDTPGGMQCSQDATCEAMASFGIDGLDEPILVPPLVEVALCTRVAISESSSTIGLGAGDDSACECSTSDRLRGHLLYGDDTCFVRSRGRTCLYAGEEFPGCDPDAQDNAACEAVCGELRARIAQDAARTFDARVRSYRCHRGRGDCAIVYEIEGRCFVSASYDEHDCSLSDEEIIERELERNGSIRTGGAPRPH